jgi:hypothetical protein
MALARFRGQQLPIATILTHARLPQRLHFLPVLLAKLAATVLSRLRLCLALAQPLPVVVRVVGDVKRRTKRPTVAFFPRPVRVPQRTRSFAHVPLVLAAKNQLVRAMPNCMLLYRVFSTR